MTAADAYQATIRLALAAGELERIDSALMRVAREISQQQARKHELLDRRARLEHIIGSPLRTTA
jgi:hypothetical protein